MSMLGLLVFGAACAVLAILGFYEKAKARKKEDQESGRSRRASEQPTTSVQR